MTRNHSWKKLAVPAALGLALSIGTVATQAQPPMDGGGGVGPGGGPGAPGAPGAPGVPPGGGSDWRNQTPEQRQQMMQQRRAETLRASLTKAGYTTSTLQDAVVTFATTQETARQTLRELSRTLNETVLNPTTTDTQVNTQLAALRSAVAVERTRTAKAQTALNTQIGYSTKPRLLALLTTMGLVGDEGLYVGAAGGPGSPGGWGGRGSGRGGRGAGERGGRGTPDDSNA